MIACDPRWQAASSIIFLDATIARTTNDLLRLLSNTSSTLVTINMANQNGDDTSPSKVATVSPDSRDSNSDNQNARNHHPSNRPSSTSPKKKKGRGAGRKSNNSHNQKSVRNKKPTQSSVLWNEDSIAEEDFSFADSPHRTSFASIMYTCCGLNFEIHGIYQAGGDLAVVYTAGLQNCGLHFVGGFPECVVFDVPTSKVDQVCRVFQFLAHQLEDHRLVKGGEIVESDNLVLETKWIACMAMRARLVDRFPFLSGMKNPSCKWLLLQPQFPLHQDHEYPRPYPMAWGSRPMAPRGETLLRDRIVEFIIQRVIVPEALAKEGRGTNSSTDVPPKLLWHVDGNPQNCSFANLQQVNLVEAFCNPTWYIDWRTILKGDETMLSYIKSHPSHFALVFRPRSGKVMMMQDETKIHFQYYPRHEFSPTMYSPMHSPAESSMAYNSNSNSNSNNSIKRGYLNVDSPNFRPGGHQNGLSLPDTPPFGF